MQSIGFTMFPSLPTYRTSSPLSSATAATATASSNPINTPATDLANNNNNNPNPANSSICSDCFFTTTEEIDILSSEKRMRSSYPVIINVPPSSSSSSLSSSLASLSLASSPPPSSSPLSSSSLNDVDDLELKALTLERKQEDDDLSYEKNIENGRYERYLWEDVMRNPHSNDEMIPYDEYLKPYVDDPDAGPREEIMEILNDLFKDWDNDNYIAKDCCLVTIFKTWHWIHYSPLFYRLCPPDYYTLPIHTLIILYDMKKGGLSMPIWTAEQYKTEDFFGEPLGKYQLFEEIPYIKQHMPNDIELNKKLNKIHSKESISNRRNTTSKATSHRDHHHHHHHPKKKHHHHRHHPYQHPSGRYPPPPPPTPIPVRPHWTEIIKKSSTVLHKHLNEMRDYAYRSLFDWVRLRYCEEMTELVASQSSSAPTQ